MVRLAYIPTVCRHPHYLFKVQKLHTYSDDPSRCSITYHDIATMSHSGTAILGISPWPNRDESLCQNVPHQCARKEEEGEETKEEEEAKEEKYLKRGNKHMASG